MLKPKEIAFCGVFGAAALLLPTVFHLFHLGKVFMPMYLPLIILPFFVRSVPAAATAVIAPLLSGALTGMPPFFPPVAVIMAVELGCMAALIAISRALLPKIPILAILIPVLLLGRFLNMALVYGLSLCLNLPPAFLAAVSLMSGWPGIIMILATVPIIIKLAGHSVSINNQ